MDHAALTKAIHSRSMLLWSVTIAVMGCVLAYYLVPYPTVERSSGFVDGWSLTMPLRPQIMLCVSAALNVGIVALLLAINKTYNLLRKMTRLNASLFLIMQLATPTMLLTLSPGAVVALVVLWGMALMYGLYDMSGSDTRRVFLLFAILSAASAADYAFVVYVLVFVLACFQLRIFSLRCLSAIILGLLTPWIIFFGFGIITPADLQMPFKAFTFPDFNNPADGVLTATVVLTVFVALTALSQNAVKYIAYNARSRSMISLVTVLTLVTSVAAILDMAQIQNYLPLLNVCASFQVAHLFTAVYNYGKAYISVFVIAFIYIVIYALSLVV